MKTTKSGLQVGAVTMSQDGMEKWVQKNDAAMSARHILPKVAGFLVFNLYNARRAVIVKVPVMRSYMDMAAIVGRRARAMRCKVEFIGRVNN